MTTPYFTPPVFSWPAAPGGKLHTYLAGGTTPQVTYSDAAGVTPNTNPVTLDSLGSAVVRLAVGVAYHFVLKDATDVSTFWDADNFDNAYLTSSSLTAAIIGAVLYPQTAAEIAAGVTPVNFAYPPGTVLRYGTNTTPGVTNMSTAFANCLAANNFCYAPNQTYAASFSFATKQKLYGDGIYQTILIPPAGATYVLQIDATSVAKQYVAISDLSIHNPNAVANCTGILFNGINVTQINDFHSVTRVEITALATGISVVGRQIWTRYEGVWVSNCTTGFLAQTDTTTPAFNQVTWHDCLFQGCTNEGFRSTGQSNTLTFLQTSIQQNNSANAVGTAGMYMKDCEEINLVGCYFENNGNSVAVNTTTPLTNSLAIRIEGTYCYNFKIDGCYVVNSGCLISITSTTIRGGEITKSRLQSLATGFAVSVAGTSQNAVTQSPYVVDGSSIVSGQISFAQDGSGRQNGALRQVATSYYMTAAETIDLLYVSKIATNTGGGAINLTTINNALPGAELFIDNATGANNVNLAAGLMASGAALNVLPGNTVKLVVRGYPNTGKLALAADAPAGGVLASSGVALTNGAAAQTATLTNGPTAGNPTKWVPINDNGTIRNIPAW